MRTVKEVADDIQYLVGVRRDLQEVLKEWAEDLIDECAHTADMCKSETPEFTKSFVETVKRQL